MRIIVIFVVCAFAIVGCSDDGDAVLPTRVSINLDNPTVEITAEVQNVPEVTDAPPIEETEEPTDNLQVEITPEATPEELSVTVGVEPETTLELTPELSVSNGSVVIRNWDELTLDDIVTLDALIRIDEDDNGNLNINLLDEFDNVLPLAMPIEQFQSLDGERIEVTGFLTEDDELGLQFVPAEGDSNSIIVSNDPFATMIAEQQETLTISIDSSLPALQMYNQLIPSINSIVDGFDLIAIVGSPVVGWSYEFLNPSTATLYRISVNVEGQVIVDYNASSVLPPESPKVSLLITPDLLDSDAVYAQLDLTEVPDFAMPTLQLFAEEDQNLFWLVNDNSGRVISATTE